MPLPRYNPDATRASLLVRLRDLQDRESWEAFFNTYWQLIYNVARRAQLNDSEAQDVAQETFAAAAKHLPGFRYDPSRGSFKGWLLKITRRRIIDQFRKRLPVTEPAANESETRTAPIEKHIDPRTANLDDLWEADWQQNLLTAALHRLKRRVDPEKFQWFDCHVNKGWPAAKVAKTFGVPVKNVYMACHRMQKLIQKEVKRLERETI